MLMLMIDDMMQAFAKYRLYLHTRAELARLPIDSRLDLDIYDIDEIARQAVWGAAPQKPARPTRVTEAG